MHCAEKVQGYELRQVGVYTVDACDWEDSKGQAVMSVSTASAPEQSATIAIDLNGDESPEELLKKMCRQALSRTT